MKQLSLFFALALGLCISCTSDLTTVSVTYNKATAVYGDLEAIRTTPLHEASRALINPGKIYVSHDLLLIGEEGEGIHIYDNSDVENPEAIGFLHIPGNKEFFVKDQKLYAESLYDMLKIDITDKSNPQQLSRVKNAFTTTEALDESNAIIGFTFEKITQDLEENDPILNEIWGNQLNTAYFDAKETLIPSSAVPSSFAGSSNAAIGTVNRIAHTKDRLYVISNSKMTVFNDGEDFQKTETIIGGWQMETIFPAKDALFVGTRSSMEIYSLDNPDAPSHMSVFSHAVGCDPVLPIDDHAYLTVRTDGEGCIGQENALLVINTQDLRAPFEVQNILMESPFGLSMIGNTLYVGEGANGLKIFDATDADDLKLIEHNSQITAFDVIAHPTRADILLVASPEGFGQYKIDADNSMDLLSWIAS